MKKIGVLALQGAVSEHLQTITQSGVEAVAVKKPEQLMQLDGLIIPGGESTAIRRLIEARQFTQPLRDFARQQKGIFGTCAGLILAARATTQPAQSDQQVKPLGLIDITVERNGFGRQIDSFETRLDIDGIGQQLPAIFIRAPYIVQTGEQVTILAHFEDKIVMAQQGNILVAAFHPELSNDPRILRYFIANCT